MKNNWIKTERLSLRPLGLKYLRSAHEYASDTENTEYMVHLPNDTIQETEQFLRFVEDQWYCKNQKVFEYAIILDEKHIGAVSLSLDESMNIGELGWILHKSYQGNGYATEAAKAIVDFAMHSDKFDLEKIVASCDYRNSSSIKVMEKLGLSLENDDGVRTYKDSDEEFQDLVFSMVV